MALAKSSMAVRFGKLDQKRAQKNAILGTLDQAINVRQRELGRFSKRYGYSVINRTTDSGTISDAVALGNNGGSALLQTSDAVYLRDTTASLWRNKGSVQRVMPGPREIVFPLRGHSPSHATSNGMTWMFARDTITGFYYYRIVNSTTGVEIVGPTKLDSGSTLDAQGKPVVAGGYVWFFYITDEGADYMLDLAKFDPASPTTAPVLSHYYPTDGSSHAGLQGLDVYLPTGGTYPLVMLYGDSFDGTGAGDVWTSLLDPATGAVKASPGIVFHDYSGLVSTGCILRGASGTGSLWLAFVTAAQNLVLKQINETTLASVADVNLAASIATTLQGVSGYFSDSSKVVFLTNATAIETSLVTRYVRTGSTTSTVFARGNSIASEPFQVNSSWYVITCHDDGAANNLQRAYYLRDASSTTTANILARALYGLGGDVFQRGGASASLFSASMDSGFFTTVTVSGNTATALLNGNVGGAADFATYKTTWDFAPSLGSSLVNIDENETVVPGGWPRHVVGEALLSEFGLPMFPRAVTVSLLSGTGTLTDGIYSATALYARPDRRGNIMRSAPAPTGDATASGSNDGVRVVVPTLRTINVNSDVVIEVYLTAPGGSVPFLVKTVANDPTADTVTVDITANPTFGEALYTGGGVLSNYPPPPFRASFLWNNRFWLVGTEHESEAWHSKEFASGISPEFTPIHKVTTYGGSGSLLAGGVISSDYAALFKRDAVFAVTGQGPDDTGGGGAFQVRRVSWDGGCTNAASVVSYPGGLLFQGLDGLIYRLSSGLALEDLGADAQDYAGATVRRAIHLPKYREVRFYLSTGTVLVLDYGNASETAPNGFWYLDDSDTFGAAVGAIVVSDLAQFVDSTGVVWVEAASQFYDGTTTPILQKLDLNTIQPFDLGGEGRISAVQFVGEWISAHDLRVSIAVDGGAAVNYDRLAIAANPEDAYVRPGGCGRVSALDIVIEERGTGTGAGFHFDGVQIEMQARGRGKRVNSTQRI